MFYFGGAGVAGGKRGVKQTKILQSWNRRGRQQTNNVYGNQVNITIDLRNQKVEKPKQFTVQVYHSTDGNKEKSILTQTNQIKTIYLIWFPIHMRI